MCENGGAHMFIPYTGVYVLLLKVLFLLRNVILKMGLRDRFYLSGRFDEADSKIQITIETYICLFVYTYCDLDVEVCIVDADDTYQCFVPACALNNVKYEYIKTELAEKQDFNFAFPAIQTEQGKTVIAGLCAVLRWAIKAHIAVHPDHYSKALLGFRGGCLVACAESSVWTKFCELQLPNSVREVSSFIKCGNALSYVPDNLALLEAHLKRPVRTHNILKRKLDIAKKVKNSSKEDKNMAANKSEQLNFVIYDNNSTPVPSGDISEKLKNLVITEKSQDFCLDHCYLEGIDFTLADMIVFPCVHYFLNTLPSQSWIHLANVIKWHERMLSDTYVKQAAEKCGLSITGCKTELSSTGGIIFPQIDQTSLYKRDPSQNKIKCKHQSPDRILSLLQQATINPKYSSNYCTKLEWDSLPAELHPANGDLPEKRVSRKCQQIESIVTAVLKVALPTQTIVEFCAGGGHVGLLLAYYLPSCKVILIENKESSMQRAKSRAEALNLKNIAFFQCNLDYFKGSFDMGVSLHACGVATDLVIQQCIKNKASFVCCPCCYGGVQNTHLLSYPLSKKFCSTGLSYKDYTLLAHFADRTEVNTPTAEQGELCMGLIDTDRALYAEESGYKAELTTLQPITCSPKHNLLIGISPLWTKHLS